MASSILRRRQFGVGALFTAVTVIALVLVVWLFVRDVLIARDRARVEAIVESILDGEAIYGRTETTASRNWLRRVTGGDFDAAITEIRLNEAVFVDDFVFSHDVLAELRKLPKLQTIRIRGKVTKDACDRLRLALPGCTVEIN